MESRILPTKQTDGRPTGQDPDGPDWKLHRESTIESEADASFEALFAHNFKTLARGLLARSRQLADAEDCVLEAFVRELKARGKPVPRDDKTNEPRWFRPFMAVLANWISLEAWRRGRREIQFEDHGHSDVPALEGGPSADRLLRAVDGDDAQATWVAIIRRRFDKLEPDQAAHIYLRATIESLEAIACVLEISEDAERMRWWRLVKTVKRVHGVDLQEALDLGRPRPKKSGKDNCND